MQKNARSDKNALDVKVGLMLQSDREQAGKDARVALLHKFTTLFSTATVTALPVARAEVDARNVFRGFFST